MDLNPYGLSAIWSQGDAVIKGVALLLMLMSIASWYVIATRFWQQLRLRGAVKAINAFWHTKNLPEGLSVIEAACLHNPFHRMVLDGHAAVEHHASNAEDLHGQLSLSEWLSESLRGSIDESSERMQSGLPLLASIGSTAPFIGLFGTVWGIYHALVGIGISGQAGIDKVAGPVGEALIMTAFGLLVAIPAVLGYNALIRKNRQISGKLNQFARQLHAYFLTGSPIQRNVAINKGAD